jgi:hypothetical protein
VQSFTSDGFVLGTNSPVNASGQTYHWVAMKAGTNVAIGTYTGNGADNRNISGVGFQPSWVITMADGGEDVFRPGLLSGDASFTLSSTAQLSNRIQAVLPDGFQVGSHADVNASGTAYYYIAFASTAQAVTGTYTGDNSDNRDITGIGINPAFLWVKRSVATTSVWRTNAVSGDKTLYWQASSPTANRIQALIIDGFQVGTDPQVNVTAQPYYYLALAP